MEDFQEVFISIHQRLKQDKLNQTMDKGQGQLLPLGWAPANTVCERDYLS